MNLHFLPAFNIQFHEQWTSKNVRPFSKIFTKRIESLVNGASRYCGAAVIIYPITPAILNEPEEDLANRQPDLRALGFRRKWSFIID